MWYVRYWIKLTLDFSTKVFFSDYLFLYAYDENNVFFIHPTTDSSYTPEAEIKYEDVVDNMVDDMLEAMEWKNDKICDDSYSRCGEEH